MSAPDERRRELGPVRGEAPGELILWDLEAEDNEERLARRFGAQGREFVRKYYNNDRMVDGNLAVYRSNEG